MPQGRVRTDPALRASPTRPTGVTRRRRVRAGHAGPGAFGRQGGDGLVDVEPGDLEQVDHRRPDLGEDGLGREARGPRHLPRRRRDEQKGRAADLGRGVLGQGPSDDVRGGRELEQEPLVAGRQGSPRPTATVTRRTSTRVLRIARSRGSTRSTILRTPGAWCRLNGDEREDRQSLVGCRPAARAAATRCRAPRRAPRPPPRRRRRRRSPRHRRSSSLILRTASAAATRGRRSGACGHDGRRDEGDAAADERVGPAPEGLARAGAPAPR